MSRNWLFPRAADVDPGWLCHLFELEPEDVRKWFDARANLRHAERRLRAYCGAPSCPSLAGIGRLSDGQRRELLEALGWCACAPLLRQIVSGEQVRDVIEQVGEARYRWCLDADATRGMLLEAPAALAPVFARTLRRGALGALALSLGAGLAERALRDDGPFVVRRLGLCLPPLCWEGRAQDVKMVADVVNGTLTDLCAAP